MKDIPASTIIDEAISKLQGLKNSRSAQFTIKELYAIRAYCDLLLRSLGEQSEERELLEKPHSHPSLLSQKVESDDDANTGSLLDF